MKRENLQRAQKLEQEIEKREAQLRMLENRPTVGIGYASSNLMIYDKVYGGAEAETEFQREAMEFVTVVSSRIRKEIQTLLNEMESL